MMRGACSGDTGGTDQAGVYAAQCSALLGRPAVTRVRPATEGSALCCRVHRPASSVNHLAYSVLTGNAAAACSLVLEAELIA